MEQDPKQIVTPYAFEVHPELLGLPLATPKRRLAALLLDLLVASVLTALGSLFLAVAASILFFWLAIRERSAIWWKNLLQFGTASFLSIGVFVLTIVITDADKNKADISSSQVITAQNADIDWGQLGQQLSEVQNSDSDTKVDQLENLGLQLISKLADSRNSDYVISDEIYTDQFILSLRDLGFAISVRDTTAMDSLIADIYPVLAGPELKAKDKKIRELLLDKSNLIQENEELDEQIANPSFKRIVSAAASDFGLSVGWIGVYFVLCLATFKGQTIGKKVLSIRVVRLNKQSIGLWYSFERFGGYFAGLATGLLGFMQIFWDANRQGIHDKIAGTVVTDLRPASIEKYNALRNKIISEENLLD
ncbi:RDD family protein [Balneola sp. MJW-20]|uniref:RDD family protein n=1 Tax=Gracilimonas aurantiaca TaxID=3234185 RepID=UPI003464FB59